MLSGVKPSRATPLANNLIIYSSCIYGWLLGLVSVISDLKGDLDLETDLPVLLKELPVSVKSTLNESSTYC